MQKRTQVWSILPHPKIAAETELNWEDIRIFLMVAELRSFRAASRHVQHSVNFVRARVEFLESQIGALLFQRDARGVKLTETGDIVRERAISMFESARSLKGLCNRRQPIRRTVHVACTEGIGNFWLLPRLIDLYEQNQGIRIRLDCDPKPCNVKSLDADVAIQLDRPDDNPELIITRLCSVHVVLFAARKYIERHGEPMSRKDLVRHNVLEIAAPQIDSDALALDEIGDTREFVLLSLNTASGQLVAAKRGAGITAMPTFTAGLTSDLVHVAKDWHLKRDLWLVFNAKAAELPHVRKAIDWIKQAFNPARYPWFRETMMSPEAIDLFIRHNQMQSMFDGYDQYEDQGKSIRA